MHDPAGQQEIDQGLLDAGRGRQPRGPRGVEPAQEGPARLSDTQHPPGGAAEDNRAVAPEPDPVVPRDRPSGGQSRTLLRHTISVWVSLGSWAA